MISKHRWLGVAGAIALLAAVGVACGEEPVEVNLCEGVVCPEAQNTSCDPADGLCKCGTGDNRIFCVSGTVCEEGENPRCVVTLCSGVQCERGESCDIADGQCKCGTTTCGEDEECVQSRCVRQNQCQGKICPAGQECDTADGQCKCGGQQCGDDQRCDDGICVDDLCKGANCPDPLVCNQKTGSCHCGSVTGPVCAAAESCSFDGREHICDDRDPCKDKICDAGSACDPNDGACRCGGFGPQFPICNEDQICIDGQCEGGDLCLARKVPCGGEFECDTGSGECVCDKKKCGSDQTCMSLKDSGKTCVEMCDPKQKGAVCENGQERCFLNLYGGEEGYCTRPGSGTNNDKCEVAHDCAGGFTCHNQEDPRCRQLCLTANGDQDCTTTAGYVCSPLKAFPGLGVCVSQ